VPAHRSAAFTPLQRGQIQPDEPAHHPAFFTLKRPEGRAPGEYREGPAGKTIRCITLLLGESRSYCLVLTKLFSAGMAARVLPVRMLSRAVLQRREIQAESGIFSGFSTFSPLLS